MKYNQATATFHQWKDSKNVFGINFQNKDEAALFANVIFSAFEKLGGGKHRPASKLAFFDMFQSN